MDAENPLSEDPSKTKILKKVYSTGILLGIALQKTISKDLWNQKYKAFSSYPSFSTVHCSHISQSGHKFNPRDPLKLGYAGFLCQYTISIVMFDHTLHTPIMAW